MVEKDMGEAWPRGFKKNVRREKARKWKVLSPRSPSSILNRVAVVTLHKNEVPFPSGDTASAVSPL